MAYFWSSGKVPYAIVDKVRRNSSFILLLIFIIATIVILTAWMPFLLQISSDQQITYTDSLIPTISVSIVGSLVLLAKGVRERDYQIIPLALHQIDIHKKVCWSVEVEPIDTLRRYRYRKYEHSYPESFRIADLRRTEASAEVALSIASLSVFIFIYCEVLILLDPTSLEWIRPIQSFTIMGIIMAPIIYSAIRSCFCSWSDYWKSYWFLIRTLTLPEELLTEDLPRLPRAVIVPIDSEDMGSIERETRFLAKKWGLQPPESTDDINEWMEWAYWWYRTKEMMKNVCSKVQETSELGDIVLSLNENPTRYDKDTFLKLLKYSLIIKTVERLADWPEVYHSIVKIIEWFQENPPSEIHVQLFDLSVGQLEELHSLPSWPIPQTVKWLVGLSILMLSLFPIVISMISAMLQS